MTNASFRAVIESGDAEALAALLHPDVEFRSPAVHAPYTGRDMTMSVLRAVMQVFEDFHYVAGVHESNDEVLRFNAKVGEREIDGVDIVTYDDSGAVIALTVMIRPMSGLRAVADAVGAKLAEMSGGTPIGQV